MFIRNRIGSDMYNIYKVLSSNSTRTCNTNEDNNIENKITYDAGRVAIIKYVLRLCVERGHRALDRR